MKNFFFNHSIYLIFSTLLLISIQFSCERQHIKFERSVVFDSIYIEPSYRSVYFNYFISKDLENRVIEKGYNLSEIETQENTTQNKGITSDTITDLKPSCYYKLTIYVILDDKENYIFDTSFVTKALSVPEIKTLTPTNVVSNSATCGIQIISDGGFKITESGFCWSNNQSPTINNNYVQTTGEEYFTNHIYGLTHNTNYYIRAYAKNELGVSYGLEQMFITKDSLPFELIFVEDGTFIMGCTSEQYGCEEIEKPTHKENVSNFFIGKFEVTQSLWSKFSTHDPDVYVASGKCPVWRVSWDSVQVFLKNLNQKYQGYNFRLPTETEWEYAARGGKNSNGYIYSGSNNYEEVAWCNGSFQYSIQCGLKKPNELGIYDMSGNVYEWCEDKYIPRKNDPAYLKIGVYRIFRGGALGDPNESARVSRRRFSGQGGCFLVIGFRIACTP